MQVKLLEVFQVCLRTSSHPEILIRDKKEKGRERREMGGEGGGGGGEGGRILVYFLPEVSFQHRSLNSEGGGQQNLPFISRKAKERDRYNGLK